MSCRSHAIVENKVRTSHATRRRKGWWVSIGLEFDQSTQRRRREGTYGGNDPENQKKKSKEKLKEYKQSSTDYNPLPQPYETWSNQIKTKTKEAPEEESFTFKRSARRAYRWGIHTAAKSFHSNIFFSLCECVLMCCVYLRYMCVLPDGSRLSFPWRVLYVMLLLLGVFSFGDSSIFCVSNRESRRGRGVEGKIDVEREIDREKIEQLDTKETKRNTIVFSQNAVLTKRALSQMYKLYSPRCGIFGLVWGLYAANQSSNAS